MKKQFQKHSGLTLIEILIALIVLLVGLVGVLSMFPAGISSSTISIEDRTAAWVAESIVQALTIAMRAASPEDRMTGTPATAKLHHDGLWLKEGITEYQFSLPLPQDPPPTKPREFAHPDGSDAKAKDIFMLGIDPKIISMYKDMVKGPDKTDPYPQYGFTFTVRRLDDTRPKDQTGDKFKPLPLYEFRVSIYRISRQPDRDYYRPIKLPEPIKDFVIQLSGQ